MDKENDLKGKPFVVAVTGGIASGKTSVCELFHEAFKIETIDTDKLSREAVTAGSRCLEEIVSVFQRFIAALITINQSHLEIKRYFF